MGGFSLDTIILYIDMTKPTYTVTTENCETAIKAIEDMIKTGLRSGKPVVVTLGRENRTTLQNSKMWPMLADMSSQASHQGIKLSASDWKDLLTGSYKQCKFVPNIDNSGLVAIGARTSQFSKTDFYQFIEFIYAAGADKGVSWSKESLEKFEEIRSKK